MQVAAEQEKLEIVKRLLTVNINVNNNSCDYNDKTVLQAAIEEEYLKIIKRLLVIKANINTTAASNY